MHNDLNTLPTLILDSKKGIRFSSGYPWIYSNEIVNIADLKTTQPGELIQVIYRNYPIAVGYYNRHSLISFRALSRNPSEQINAAFFSRNFMAAKVLREQFFSAPFYRLIHTESDNLPGLIIDRFDDVFIVQVNTAGMQNLKSIWIEALTNTFKPRSIIINYDTSVRLLEGLTLEEAEYIGEKIKQLKIIENNVEFVINVENSQKTGWFFDHRHNRFIIAQLAHNKTVIDYFCYSGGFAVQAAVGGATKVIGVDRSPQAIQNAKEAANLNKVNNQCDFVCTEIFKDLENRITNNEVFDIVILDPPAFIKSKKDVMVGLKGYEKLLNQGIKLVKPQGILLFASCSYHSTEADLQVILQKVLAKNKRHAKIIDKIRASWDHPIHPFLKESEYLKGFLIAFSM